MSDPLDVWCPVCHVGPTQRCRAITVGLDPMRTLVHRGRAMDTDTPPSLTCQNCGNDDAATVLALCMDCVESLT